MNKFDLWQLLKSNLINKNVDYSKVERAFNLADSLHENQTRKSGEPYIIHPLEVALILEKLDFDVDVICSALLHDTIEDCDYTLDKMKLEFGKNVAQIVDSVSAIDNSKYIFDNSDIYESEEFLQSSMEEQTFKKLVSLGKKNPLGLYVKFADRLHNLRTISIFPKYKQLEKVKETERWVLPLALTLNSRYFYDEIKNECFKIVKGDETFFFEQYKFYHSVNDKNLMQVVDLFKNKLNENIFKDFIFEPIKEYQVFDFVSARNKGININRITQGQILKVPTYKIFLIYKGDVKDAISDFFDKQILFKEYGIRCIGENLGKVSNLPYLKLVDKFNNIICVYFLTKKNFFEHRIGTTEGLNLDLLDDVNTHKIITSFIKVRSATDEIIYMPEGSTVLDFAFKICKDIGLGFKYAIINDSKIKQPPYTVLKENDKVEIFVERNKYNEIKNKAELKWFAYVETDYAKKLLIKYFEKRIN